MSGEMNNLARTAKMLLREMDLKVAELVLNGAAKDVIGRGDKTRKRSLPLP
jgi:hypothetical protein